MHYEVPGVSLITQDKNMACWYASAMMVLGWAEQYRPRLGQNQCSAVDLETMKIYKANNGLRNPQIIPLARRLGLAPIPPMSPSISGLTKWLQGYGPLWTNGTSHIVVIAGIRGSEGEGYDVKVYDPWPGNGVEWRSLSGWYTGFNPGNRAASSRDTGKDVEAVFLHAA
jgi:hypothetical protein